MSRTKYPRFQHLFTREFDELLIKLVGIYGENKWADITRQLNQIHGYDIKDPHAAPCRWNKINPKIDRTLFTPDQTVEFWDLCLKTSLNYTVIKKYYESKNQFRDKGLISHRFYSTFRKQLADMNRLIGKSKNSNKISIYGIMCSTKKKVLEIYDKDTSHIQDEITKEIIESCRKLIKAMTFMINNYYMERGEKSIKLTELVGKDNFENIIQQLSLVDLMVRIQYNNINVADKIQVKQQYKEKKKNPILTWEDARDEPDESDQEQEDQLSQQQKRFRSWCQDLTLTQEEIKHTKESFLYRLLIDDIWARFYTWYNEAKIPKITDRQFVVDVEAGENNEKHEQEYIPSWNLKKLKPNQPNVQIKKPQDENKIKTIRGCIRVKKEQFPGCLTKIFKYNEQDEEKDGDFVDLDPEMMYKMAIGNNEKSEDK